MKSPILILFLMIMSTLAVLAQNSEIEQEIITLSKQKWEWMSEKNVDTLDNLFHEKSVFVHMGGSWGKEQEI
ncbi:MAG: nuclear transport factor 2 family protein, partial [Bacteroidetes bacterium]|nr:nuclear transport factor 2 family protein [Bacteroidota bacterium]